MKRGRFAMLVMVGMLAIPPVVFADDESMSDKNTTDNPYAQYDPDGVPLAVTQGSKRKAPTREQLEAAKKQQQEEAYNRNWLLRGYEEQLKLHNGGRPSEHEDTSNLNYDLSLNKDLARLARMPEMATDLETKKRPPVTPAPSDPYSARQEDSAKRDSTHSSSLAGYKLFSPMGGSNSSMGRSLYSPIGTATGASPGANGTTDDTPPVSTYKSKLPQNDDSSDLDTPGMIASKNDALSDPHATDLTLDLLPGETPEQARRAAAASQPPELPVVMDVEEFHRQQEAALHPFEARDAAKKKKEEEQIPVAQPVPPPTDVPMPISKQQPINPVRPAIEDPFEILNH